MSENLGGSLSLVPVTEQVARANESGRVPVVFIHGLWLLPASWDRWAELFDHEGFAPLAPGWPDDPATVEPANQNPETFAGKTVGQVTDHYEHIIERRPLLILSGEHDHTVPLVPRTCGVQAPATQLRRHGDQAAPWPRPLADHRSRLARGRRHRPRLPPKGPDARWPSRRDQPHDQRHHSEGAHDVHPAADSRPGDGRPGVRRRDLAPPIHLRILCVHGAGWVLGSPQTHGLLVGNLAVGAQAAVVFPHYRRASEAQYPAQIEEAYATAEWIVEHGGEHDLDPSHLAIAGDSVGGNLTIAVALMAKERGGPPFAEGYFLAAAGMEWFWDQYLPDKSRRSEILASPLRATTDELSGLPPALVINGEADVLRDEGDAYATKLRAAGVPVTATCTAASFTTS